jgi:hypothetical protein
MDINSYYDSHSFKPASVLFCDHRVCAAYQNAFVAVSPHAAELVGNELIEGSVGPASVHCPKVATSLAVCCLVIA